MSRLEDALVYEAAILAREYSPLRRKWHHWRYKMTLKDSRAQGVYEFSHEKNNVILAVHNSTHTNFYLLPSLLQRIAIKRDQQIFSQMLDLWNMINPFSLATLSRKVYVRLNSFLYLNGATGLPDPLMVQEYIANDMVIDYQETQGLSFWEFFDSMFEIIDNFAKSKLLREYVKILEDIQEKVKDSRWFHETNFKCTDHLQTDEKKTTLAPWMQALIQHVSLSLQDEVPQHKARSPTKAKQFNMTSPTPTSRRAERIDRVGPLERVLPSQKSKDALSHIMQRTARRRLNFLNIKASKSLEHSPRKTTMAQRKQRHRIKSVQDSIERNFHCGPLGIQSPLTRREHNSLIESVIHHRRISSTVLTL